MKASRSYAAVVLVRFLSLGACAGTRRWNESQPTPQENTDAQAATEKLTPGAPEFTVATYFARITKQQLGQWGVVDMAGFSDASGVTDMVGRLSPHGFRGWHLLTIRAFSVTAKGGVIVSTFIP